VKTVLLIAPDEALRARLLRALGDYSVFAAQGDADALKTLRLVDIDVVLRDSTGPARGLEGFVAAVRGIAPATLTIAVGPHEDEAESADFVLATGFMPRELEGVLRHATEKQRLVREVQTLRAQATAPAPPATSGGDASADTVALARALKEFTSLFAAGFDLPRVLDMFLNAIGELVRPTRSAILLPDNDGQHYRVVANRGLAAQIVESVRLPAGGGLARWLATQGRPALLGEVADQDLARTLRLLQSVMAVPLLTRGDLVAILVVGQPVAGGPYGRREAELLFDLATHLATAIRDIALHHHLAREKEFNERILAHMSSGVVTIGRDQRVGAINRRAEEILGLSAAGVLRQDLRVLPSPLGDMLFETLRAGRALPRTEVQLALHNLWLEVSTYPVHGEELAPLGAVLVFEDLTAQKELAAQKRQAEQLQLLTRVVARIADEIKNPLVSINTFIELLAERYDDPEFRKSFTAVVGRDVRRLVQVFEKLVGLVTEGELHFATVDVHTVVDEVVTSIELAEDATGRPKLDVARDASTQPVRVDAAQLKKALSYLVWYLTHSSSPDEAVVSLSIGRHTSEEGPEDVRVMVASRTAKVSPEKLQRIFDPVRMVQESLIEVGPAVSQRLIEALGGTLRYRQGRHELAFLVSLPVATT